jgi:hypothetical protein
VNEIPVRAGNNWINPILPDAGTGKAALRPVAPACHSKAQTERLNKAQPMTSRNQRGRSDILEQLCINARNRLVNNFPVSLFGFAEVISQDQN